MKPAYPNPPISRLVFKVNDKEFEIDYVNHNIGMFYTLDIDNVRYHYFQKRFHDQLRKELSIDLKQIFKGKPYFKNVYLNYNNLADGT
jgi:hypothetical protein